MMKPLVIFGTGDIAQLANYYFTNDSPRKVAAFCVDAAFLSSTQFEQRPVVAFEEVTQAFPPDEYDLFIALSYNKMNKLRESKYHAAKAIGYRLASYQSSRCSYLAAQSPGDNCFILEDNTIQPFVTIGNNVTLWSGNHIGHHSVIEDHNFISSHVVVSGHCHIEPNCFLGVNATLRNGLRISRETVVGAGAIIMKNTIAKGVYLPDRAKLFDRKSDEIEL